MGNLIKKIAVLVLAVTMMASLDGALPVHGQTLENSRSYTVEAKAPEGYLYSRIIGSASIFACGVPIPDSKPGEEKKDIMVALIGLSTIMVTMTTALWLYKKKNTNTTA